MHAFGVYGVLRTRFFMSPCPPVTCRILPYRYPFKTTAAPDGAAVVLLVFRVSLRDILPVLSDEFVDVSAFILLRLQPLNILIVASERDHLLSPLPALPGLTDGGGALSFLTHIYLVV